MFLLDPVMIRAARDLCADSGKTNPEYVRGIAELIIDTSVGLTSDEHKDALIAWLGSPLVDPTTAPLTNDQRRAMFASYNEVFGETANRYAFTRLVLGKSKSAAVSWSAYKPGTLTMAEASQVLNALRDLGA